MSTTYTLTPDESVTLRRHTPEALEVEVTYAAGAAPPPKHLHPAQDERFEVLSGTVHAEVDGTQHVLRAGDALDIPRGAAHRLSNAGEEPARAIWETRPAGRTLEWFAALDAQQRAGNVGRDHMPGPLVLGALLTEYRDVMRLAARPRWLVTALLAALALAGRAGAKPAEPVTSPASRPAP